MNEKKLKSSSKISYEKVKVGRMVSESENAALFQILKRHADCFANNSNELGTVRGSVVEIKLKSDAKPVCYRSYSMA